MISVKTLGRRSMAYLIALAIAPSAFGTIFTTSASDRTKEKETLMNEKVSENSQAAQTGQPGQVGTSTIENQQSVAITVYNSNIGLVKDTRTLRLPRGASQLRFMDVAQQINLLSAANFDVKKELVLNGQPYYFQGYNNPGEPIKEKIGVFIGFKNSKENSLGQPLPAGIVRVYKADSAGAQQFVGEDRIDHTPKDESVRIKLGDAFDVVAERKQTDYKAIARRVFEYAYEIRIRNHKEEAVTVVVNEPIGGDWEIVNSSFPAEKTAAFAARFNVPVAKDGEAVLSYRVRVKF